MDDTQPTLLLTRPAAQSAEFVAMCEAKTGFRLPVVLSPLMEIEPLGDAPDPAQSGALIFTSSNGLRILAEQYNLHGCLAYCVGTRTTELARSKGLNAFEAGRNVEELTAYLAGVVQTGHLLHIRGVHTRGNLTGRLQDIGIPIDEAVIYDQVSRPLTQAAQALLSGRSPVVVPVFSPRSATLLRKSASITAPLTVIAMSSAIAKAWDGPGAVVTAPEATADAMASQVTSYF